ncbi:L,D-transpeptidase family protein [Enhydrobacter aerosaccus]|uniref:L,D-transpeptidase family protein n=1 Tax=Enhydrobacter aerosaccus TaxID=225324 RepID=UPI0014827B27|nr:L,D-transpeptidase family protein [Enhydrobacter aerosaccus]
MKRVHFLVGLLALIAPVLGSDPSLAADHLWTGSRAAEARAAALLGAIRAAGDHGLDPDWYRLADLEKAVSPGGDQDRAEQLLTDAFVAYASDVSTGRVRANSVDKDIDIQQRKADRSELLKQAADATDFPAWLASLPPKGDYPLLQKTLATLRLKRKTATFTAVPSGDALKPGMIDSRVPLLRKRLAELDMAVPVAGPVSDLYDEPLAAVIKTYQATKGLTVDGVIGAKTTQSLNTGLDERIDQVVANLERRRWLPEDLGSRYVFVNAGDYSMVFVNGGRPVFHSLVIVGTAKNPTPEIASVMHGFQINPYWTVPQSISGEEYLPMLRRDPNALAASGFRIFSSWSDNDSEIDPSTVDWNAINPKAFPFRIRQDPGANNALGYIFFPFANKYGIYMHDTATRWLFTEGSRNFSHGCIRLQNPLDFVEKVYGSRGFDKDKVRAAIDDGQQVGYGFPEPVRLYVTYRTVTANAEGSVSFRDDVYGRDRRVVQAMGRPRS